MVITTVLEQKKRNGTVGTLAFAAPANLTGTFAIVADIAFADLIDPTKRLSLKIFADGEQVAGFDWVGGATTDKNGNIVKPPRQTINAALLAGKSVTVTIAIPSPITLGVYLETA